MICPYCGDDKPSDVFTAEHVLPRALGGAIEPTNPFKLPVCRDCNILCGKHVDGPAARNWLTQVGRSGAKYAFAANAPAALSVYMGRLESWEDADTVCDFWIGPSGDQLYHFHKPYPGTGTEVGGPSWANKSDLDPGVMLVCVRATNPAWHPVIFRSLNEQFPRAQKHAVNDSSRPVPGQYSRELEWVRAAPEEKKGQVLHDIHCGDRFTAKVALGLAALALGEPFVLSADASKLRAFLRDPRPERRAALGVRGHALHAIGNLEGAEKVREVFGWRDCHTLALVPVGDALAFVGVLFGKYPFSLGVTRDPALWSGRLDEGGRAWVVAPWLRAVAGPAPVPHALIDMRKEVPDGPLQGLYARLVAVPEAPPYDLDDNGSTKES